MALIVDLTVYRNACREAWGRGFETGSSIAEWIASQERDERLSEEYNPYGVLMDFFDGDLSNYSVHDMVDEYGPWTPPTTSELDDCIPF